ncbi:hypothetical protein A3K73_02510 [Candidatus Pacearchaeota archaeon RBG_13_36_9]|nr:MAG: hypothetical protein A3K73_02510 [Candidatus Pacearchaeota archaeon RBG_13_36_9]
MKPDVKPILPREVPENYRLGVDGWSFPKGKLMEKLADGTRKLLTLDISISPDSFVEAVNTGNLKGLQDRVNHFYNQICPNNCTGCFEKGDIKHNLLSWEEVKKVLNEARGLGLESVKFLGPGEIFTNPNLFGILDYFQENKIKIGIFTKGETLGDDKLSRRYQQMSSEELTRKVCNYDVTRILIDCRTFDARKTNMLVHSLSGDYSRARNHAIELLVENGMNSDLFCQRMSLQTNPVTLENIGDVLEIFIWGVERNMPVCVTPTMVSGKGRNFVSETKGSEFQKELIGLYSDIYVHLIKRGIMNLNQLEQEGVSSYAGIMPCNQLSCGMYIRKDGVVQCCPGNDGEPFTLFEDVRKKNLREIWTQSKNYALGPLFNNRCVKDGYSIPVQLYDEVLANVKKELKKL